MFNFDKRCFNGFEELFTGIEATKTTEALAQHVQTLCGVQGSAFDSAI